MHNSQLELSDRPVWQRRVRRRLAASMLAATLLVAAGLLLVRFPVAPAPHEASLTLRLLPEESRPEPADEYPAVAELPAPPIREAESLRLSAPDPVDEVVTRDWYAIIDDVVRETVDAASSTATMHPAHEEKRRRAALLFAPSRAPVKKPVWENVETDQMGRKVLVSGDCYRVLEDWRATYQDIHRELGQYLVHCNSNKVYPIDVDWVDDVGQKYAVMRFPDGEIPPDEFASLTRQN